MYRVELHLNDYDEVRLDEFRFFDSDTSQSLITVNGGSPSYCTGASKNLFNWTIGVRAVTHLLLKAALTPTQSASICGDAGSLAASLDYALSKEPAWLIDFFGMTSRGDAVARKLFGRRNSERKRPGPVEVYLNNGLLPSTAITVFLRGERFHASRLPALIDAIENRSAKNNVAKDASSTTSPSPAKDDDFPLTVIARTLSEHIDTSNSRVTYYLRSVYRNTGTTPVTFLHYNLVKSDSSRPETVRVESPSERFVTWSPVIDTSGDSRILVTFEKPLLPGERRQETVVCTYSNFHDTDGRLTHFNRFPMTSLTLEVSCPDSHRFASMSILAERDDHLLFSTLPRIKRTRSSEGQPVLRWKMKNPPQGYRFRLIWGIQPTIFREKHTVRSQSQAVIVIQTPP